MNKKLHATIEIGGAITGALKSALGTTRDKLLEIGGAVRKLEKEQKALGAEMASMEKAGRDLGILPQKYATLTAAIEKARREQEKLRAAQEGMNAGKGMMATGGMMLGAAAAAASTAFVPVIQAAAFEKAMLGVAKQVEGARDENGKLTQVYFDMAKQVQNLGDELPMATNEIAGMVAAGARMGVAKDELIDFTRTAGMMASAFELPAGELADQMGKIAGLFKIPIPKIGELADAINYLDDNAISNGGDIIEVMKRIGGTAEFVKMPAKEAAALASTFLTLGSSAEVAGTAANAVMRELSIATMQPKRFQQGLAAIGMDAKKVQQDMSKDATGTIQKVLDALNNLPEEKRLTVATQLFGKEYGDDIAKLASGVDEYRRQLALASSDKAIGSMAREHQARLQTTTAQWEIAKNKITRLGVNIGSVLLPAVNQALSVFGAAARAVADFVGENRALVGNIATVVGAVVGSVGAWGAMKLGVGAVVFAFNALKLAMATNPIGLLAIGLVTAAALIYKNWGPISGFFTGLFNSIKETIAGAIDWIVGKIQAVGEFWGKTKAFFGFGDSNAPTAGSPPSPTPPGVPKMATAPGAAGATTTNQTNTINITQQPGQDSKALAAEVAKQLAERQKVQARGRMYDAAMGY